MYKCRRNSRKTPIDWLNLYIVKSKSKGKMHRIRNNWGWHQHERTKPCVLQLCCFVHFSSSNLLIEKSLFFEKKRNATIHTSQHFQFLCFCEIIILVLILDNKQTHQITGDNTNTKHGNRRMRQKKQSKPTLYPYNHSTTVILFDVIYNSKRIGRQTTMFYANWHTGIYFI